MSANLSSALETFKQQRTAAEAHYLKANRVSVFFRECAAAVETLLAALWAEHFQNSALCLMATGGFGRGVIGLVSIACDVEVVLESVEQARQRAAGISSHGS